MNNKTRNILGSLAIVGVLLGAQNSAYADDGLTTRIAASVGRVIADQGNAALMQIREELRDTLDQSVRKLINDVQPAATASADTNTNSSDTAH